jgi:hypothetical protein
LRKQKSEEKRSIKTLCGELELYRDYYYCRHCGYSEIPLDKRLGMEGDKHKITTGMEVEIAYFGQNQSSFEGGSQLIQRIYGMYINEETVREITEDIGRAVHEADAEAARKSLEEMQGIEMLDENEKQDTTLYIMIDGAAVNTRVEDENGSTWRENKTVMVFTERDMIKRKGGNHKIVKKEYSALIGSAEEFKGFVLNAAVKAGYGKIKQAVVIADGAAWIRNMCNEIFPDALQILDLYHLKENVYTYAKEKFNQDEKTYVPWAERTIDLLEKGEADMVLNELSQEENSATKTVNLKTYIENNKEKIRYNEYRAKGYFVGSGAIESANKIILQRRLKQAGMRWSVDGAQAVLALRCKVESGLWAKEVYGRFCA